MEEEAKIKTTTSGEKVLMPYLLDRKIAVVDYVIVSHMDFDHVRSEFCI